MLAALFVLAFAAAPGPDSAASLTERTDPAPPRPARLVLAAGVGVERFHDDNILQLTARSLDRLSAGPSPPRFLVTTPGDDVDALHAEVRGRLRWLRRRETRLGVAVDVDRYAVNAVKDWEQYRFDAAQEITASRRFLTTARVWASRTPNFYLGQITDDDESFTAGTRIRHPLAYAETEIGAHLDQEMVRGRLAVGAGALRRHRDYGEHFAERDNVNVEWQVDASVHPFRRWGLELGLDWRTGRLDARGDLPATEVVDRDISYDHHGLGLSVTAPWEIFGRRGRATWEYEPETRAYTTADKFDLTRFERTNERRQHTVTVSQRLAGPLEAAFRWSRLTSEASFPDGERLADDRTDFEQNRTGFQLRVRKELFSR